MGYVRRTKATCRYCMFKLVRRIHSLNTLL
ncbi:MAG: hypothetical protein F2651_04220 [Actinobacteria bacterium]|nr:hypothetical protein [Actinomycetota bacterium]MSV71404.1 hypothetical protein [Actinomycetota bacterium]MSW13732.1 hypothetical protein [Actinomycetota bacterium]MSX46577.1 hypothetical protein [Actinomycetota bacterium]MSX91284.1 hypothetical protein [Actinomycetota bacterium]